MQTKDIAIIGAGPAGLIAAERLAQAGHRVTIHERMASPARKFLLAGRGGLNLTHSEPLDAFLPRYGAARDWLEPAITAFPPQSVRDWADGLGAESFVGSSGRVFPKAMKASPLLRAWLRRLDGLGVKLEAGRLWTGWTADGALSFATGDGEAVTLTPDATLLALGGASWPRLGSDGGWVPLLAAKGVAIAPLRPANGGYAVDWSATLRERFAGAPLKRIVIRFAGQEIAGEAMIDANGIEGGAIYALSAPLRDAVVANGTATLNVALRPDLNTDELIAKLSAPRGKQSLSTFLRKAVHLPPVGIALLQEAAMAAGTSLASLSTASLAGLINAMPIVLSGVAPIARAISTAGGIALDELDADYMIAKLPGVFAAGEMLDWEAPTGGYLLQASFATGAAAGRGVVTLLERRSS